MGVESKLSGLLRTSRRGKATHDISLIETVEVEDVRGSRRIIRFKTHPDGPRRDRRAKRPAHPVYTKRTIVDDWRCLPRSLKEMMKKRLKKRRKRAAR